MTAILFAALLTSVRPMPKGKGNGKDLGTCHIAAYKTSSALQSRKRQLIAMG